MDERGGGGGRGRESGNSKIKFRKKRISLIILKPPIVWQEFEKSKPFLKQN